MPIFCLEPDPLCLERNISVGSPAPPLCSVRGKLTRGRDRTRPSRGAALMFLRTRRWRCTTLSLTRRGPSSWWGRPASAGTSSGRDCWTTRSSLLPRFPVSKPSSLLPAVNNPFLSILFTDTSRPKESGEIDGSDYHFITRSQFESQASGGKFLEHGEYDKQYYGTSLER